MKDCAGCRYSHKIGPEVGPGANDGVCRRFPPDAISDVSSAFPPVHLLNFRCGEHKPRRQRWWQFWRSK